MDYLIKPWSHQLKGIEMARRQRDLALFMEMGTGKTCTTINIIREHFARNKGLLRTLILGPVITVKNWQNEFGLHSKIRDYDIIPLTGPGKRRVQTMLEACTEPRTQTLTRPKILITNYEAMEMEDLVSLLSQWQPEILICDESQRLKNHEGKRARAVIRLLGEEAVIGTNPVEYTRKTKHVYILTGTPILNTPMDIFNQYRVLDSGKTFGLNFYEFRARYFEDLNKGMPSDRHFPRWVCRPESFEIFNNLIYRKAIRVLKKDCLDLPPLLRKRIAVELSPSQRKLYEEMKHEYITWIKAHEHSDEPKAVVAQMAITKALRLQQIVSGFAKTEDGQEISVKDNPRLDVVDDMVPDIVENGKLIIWATFKHNYKQLADVLNKRKIKFVELHGGISTAQKNKNIERFRQDEDCRVVIANQAAAGIGINLVEAGYSMFYSRNFSLEQDLQAEARNYRGGSEIHESVTRYDLVAEGTIDELAIDSLADKQGVAEQILDWSNKL